MLATRCTAHRLPQHKDGHAAAAAAQRSAAQPPPCHSAQRSIAQRRAVQKRACVSVASCASEAWRKVREHSFWKRAAKAASSFSLHSLGSP